MINNLSVLLFGAVFVVGCASAQQPPASPARSPQPRAAKVSDGTVDDGAGDGLAATPHPPATAQAAARGIPRAELNRFLNQGPQYFIRSVRVRPAFRHRRFYGWRIISYRGPGPIQVGDVVMRVNDRSIERPDQFMAVWTSLKKSPALTVKLRRGGKELALDYPIVD